MARQHVRKGRKAREDRQIRAKEAQSEREAFSPREQIAALDARLGVGQGAKRERARLQALIDTARKPKKKEPHIKEEA
jgi:hypothetical protein